MQRMNVLRSRDTTFCKKRPLGARFSQLVRCQKDRLFMQRIKFAADTDMAGNRRNNNLQKEFCSLTALVCNFYLSGAPD